MLLLAPGFTRKNLAVGTAEPDEPASFGGRAGRFAAWEPLTSVVSVVFIALLSYSCRLTKLRLLLLIRRRHHQVGVLQESGFPIPNHLLFSILGHEQAAWVVVCPPVFNETHRVAPDDSVGCLRAFVDFVDFFHAENHVGPRRVLDVVNRANREVRNDVAVLDLADRIRIPKLPRV